MWTGHNLRKKSVFDWRPELLWDGSTHPVEAERKVGRMGGCRGRRVGCGPAGTRQGLTQALCSGHMAFVISHWERDSPLAPPPPPLPHHISLYPTFPPSLSPFSCRDLEAWSALVVYCALNAPLSSFTPTTNTTTRPPKLRSVKRKMAQRRRGCWRCEALSDGRLESSQEGVRF